MSLHFLESLIGGSLHGGSVLEGAWGALMRLMAGNASEIAGSIARGVVGGGSTSYSLLDVLTDVYLFSDGFGRSGSKGNSTSGHPVLNDHAENGLKSHAFLLQQLSANKHEKGVEPILKDYAALGANLPGEDLLKRTYRKLFSIFRADQVTEAGDHRGNPLAHALGEAKAHLENSQVVHAYNQSLEENRGAIESALEKISKFDWKAAYEKAERSSQLKLGFNGAAGGVISKAQQWTSGLSGLQKTGLAFGVVTAIGIGAYGVAKVVESIRARRKPAQKAPEEAPEAVDFTQRMKAREAQPNVAAGIG